jgi:hypothetical protein
MLFVLYFMLDLQFILVICTYYVRFHVDILFDVHK